MKSLRLIQLLVLSNTAKSANQFKFSKNLNLITAKDNSVGKSTLLKLIFWGLGCEPELDTTWNAQDCKTIVDFEVADKTFRVKRYKNEISIKEGSSDYEEFQKITGEYSQRFAEIVGFSALLPNQNSGLLETPPPAYYFIPFYIDQKRSWAKAWDNFDRLGQYRNWKSTIIKYHVGLLKPEHFELESERTDKKESQKNIEYEVEKIDTTLEVIESYVPDSVNTVTTVSAINKITDSIKKDLESLQKSQEELLHAIAINNSEKSYLYQQQVMTEKLISELDKDYKYSVENIEDDEIECPLCGVVHENSIVNRASIMTDKNQAENQLKEIIQSTVKIDKKITSNERQLESIKSQISEINEKYVIEDETEIIDFNQIIESVAGNSIKSKVTISKNIKNTEIAILQEEIKDLKKKQKSLTTEEETDSILNSFNSILSNYVKLLDAEAVNLSEINSPLDYNKVIKEGGAAEGARAILGYYLTIFSMVEKFGNEAKSPLVIDTPNQQEQSFTNYEKIVELLTDDFLDGNQIIMSAMENEQLKPFANKAQIITLDENKLLSKEKYDEVKNIFK
ncbi:MULTISPECIES: hypothetical protein [unclassified Allomuricauda]|uniref:hypothetical protein n=1 Tax=unclassified Allomuricauda TaxID=2615049 RepID=UPI00273F294B|nr:MULTISPECIES: hypothetical protein [unclassified Allomuricauda]